MGQHGAVRRPAAVNYWEGTASSTWQFLVGNLLILTSLAVGVLFLVNPSFLNLSTTDSIGGGITLILASQVLVAVIVLSSVRVVIDGDYIAWQPRLYRRALRKYRWHQIQDVELFHARGYLYGWGLRWMPKIGWGHIIRSGPAIRIIQNNGKSFVITVDDAETAVAVAQKFVDAARPASYNAITN